MYPISFTTRIYRKSVKDFHHLLEMNWQNFEWKISVPTHSVILKLSLLTP